MGRKRLPAMKFRFGETIGFLELLPSSQNFPVGIAIISVGQRRICCLPVVTMDHVT